MSLLKNKKLAFLITLNFFFLNGFLLADDSSLSNINNGLSFSMLEKDFQSIDEDSYFDFIRASILTQPEFMYANSNVEEKSQSLKFAKRQRFPELSMRVINDKVINRDVSDFSSIRKRQDDSFDAAVEISQPLYSGGSIRGQIRKSITDESNSIIDQLFHME